MKNILTIFLITAALGSCVQKTSRETVVYTLNVEDSSVVKGAGIRGRDKPLNWDSSFKMDSVAPNKFQSTVSYETGYKFTEVKFTLNDEFEMQNAPNRIVNFAESDTTYYTATFNKN